MSTFRAAEYERRTLEVHGFPIRISSYRLQDRWLSKIDNVDPGACMARGKGATREEAEQDALKRATHRLLLSQKVREARRALDELSNALDL